jgi:hypothetical protein
VSASAGDPGDENRQNAEEKQRRSLVTALAPAILLMCPRRRFLLLPTAPWDDWAATLRKAAWVRLEPSDNRFDNHCHTAVAAKPLRAIDAALDFHYRRCAQAAQAVGLA